MYPAFASPIILLNVDVKLVLITFVVGAQQSWLQGPQFPGSLDLCQSAVHLYQDSRRPKELRISICRIVEVGLSKNFSLGTDE